MLRAEARAPLYSAQHDRVRLVVPAEAGTPPHSPPRVHCPCTLDSRRCGNDGAAPGLSFRVPALCPLVLSLSKDAASVRGSTGSPQADYLPDRLHHPTHEFGAPSCANVLPERMLRAEARTPLHSAQHDRVRLVVPAEAGTPPHSPPRVHCPCTLDSRRCGNDGAAPGLSFRVPALCPLVLSLSKDAASVRGSTGSPQADYLPDRLHHPTHEFGAPSCANVLPERMLRAEARTPLHSAQHDRVRLVVPAEAGTPPHSPPRVHCPRTLDSRRCGNDGATLCPIHCHHHTPRCGGRVAESALPSSSCSRSPGCEVPASAGTTEPSSSGSSREGGGTGMPTGGRGLRRNGS